MKQLFNAVAVAIPAQQFLVRSFVLLERQVPVMTEFAVRLLHISGPLELSVIQAYFGLSSIESRELLSILRVEGLVEEKEGRLNLTSYATARFVSSDDDLPRFTRIAERAAAPIFELISFSPIPRSASQYWDNTLELEWSGREDGAKHKDLAEEAYHRHFHDLEFDRDRDDDRTRAFDVYKVTSIIGGKHFNIPLPIYFTVDVEGNVDYEYDQLADRLGADLMSKVTQMTSDRIGRQPRRADHFATFVKVFDDEILSKYVSKTVPSHGTHSNDVTTLDFSRYVREVHGLRGGEVYDKKRSRAMLGALYLEHNRRHYFESLKNAVKKSYSSNSNGHSIKESVEMFWIIPMSDLWGRTRLVQDFVRELHEFWLEEAEVSLELTAVFSTYQVDRPERVRRAAHLLLDAGFSDVVLGPAPTDSERFEALVCPGIHGAALYEWKVPSSVGMGVPVGFVSYDENKLRKLLTFLQHSLARKQRRAYWTDEEVDDVRKLALVDLLPGEFFYLDSYAESSE